MKGLEVLTHISSQSIRVTREYLMNLIDGRSLIVGHTLPIILLVAILLLLPSATSILLLKSTDLDRAFLEILGYLFLSLFFRHVVDAVSDSGDEGVREFLEPCIISVETF